MRINSVFCLTSVCVSHALAMYWEEEAPELADIVSQLSEVDDTSTWDENSAVIYLNELIIKHGTKLQQEADEFRRFGSAAENDIFQKRTSEEERIWHVGEASLTKFDETIFASMVGKLKEMWPSSVKLLDKWKFHDSGLFFFSIRDTDIFEDL